MLNEKVRIAPVMLLLCLSCSKGPAIHGDFWVAGLTLPPGSEIVSRYESDVPGDATYVPTKGQPDRSLMIGFNSAGGWDKVSAHIDKCMRKLGYSETMDEIKKMTKNMPGGAGMIDQDLGRGMRMYMKRGSKFSVSLIDNVDFTGVRDPAELEMMEMGQFELYIKTFK